MTKFRGSRGISCLLFVLVSQLAEAATLQEWFDLEAVSPNTSLPPTFKEYLRGKHLVFIDGFMNELANIVHNYFYDNIKEVNRLGISYSHLGFSSAASIPENADLLYENIEEIIRREQKPVVLIGHSMGGAQSLYMVLKHPEVLILNQVERVVLIEASVGGSDLVERFKTNWVAYGIEFYLRNCLLSLSRQQARENFFEVFDFFQNRLEALLGPRDQVPYQKEFERISSRVFYIRSQYNPKTSLSFGLKMVHAFLREKLDDAVPNDGLVLCEDQVLRTDPDFGTDLGILDGDHIEFVIAGMVSRGSSSRRAAFTRAMLRSIYDPIPTQSERVSTTM